VAAEVQGRPNVCCALSPHYLSRSLPSARSIQGPLAILRRRTHNVCLPATYAVLLLAGLFSVEARHGTPQACAQCLLCARMCALIHRLLWCNLASQRASAVTPCDFSRASLRICSSSRDWYLTIVGTLRCVRSSCSLHGTKGSDRQLSVSVRRSDVIASIQRRLGMKVAYGYVWILGIRPVSSISSA
jgi:hypothetical protein